MTAVGNLQWGLNLKNIFQKLYITIYWPDPESIVAVVELVSDAVTLQARRQPDNTGGQSYENSVQSSPTEEMNWGHPSHLSLKLFIKQ